jgi:hypothetical protein
VSPNVLFWTRYVLSETVFLAVLGVFLIGHLRLDEKFTAWRCSAYIAGSILLLQSRPVAVAAVLVSAGFLLASVVQRRGIQNYAKACVLSFCAIGFTGLLMLSVAWQAPSFRQAVLSDSTFSALMAFSARMKERPIQAYFATYKDIRDFEAALGPGLTEKELNVAVSRDSLGRIRQEPWAYLANVVNRVVCFWHPWAFYTHWSPKHRLWDAGLSMLLSWVLLTLIIRKDRQRRQVLQLIGIAVGFALLSGLHFDADARYRLPTEYILLLLAPKALDFARLRSCFRPQQ